MCDAVKKGSECFIPDARRPDRRTAFKVLVKKTFSFVDGIWSSYTQKNTVAIRFEFFVLLVHVVHVSLLMVVVRLNLNQWKLTKK